MATNRNNVELVISAKNEATKTLNELVQSLDDLAKEGEGEGGVLGLFRKLTKSSGDLSQKYDELSKSSSLVEQAQKKITEATEKQKKDFESQESQIDKLNASLSELNDQYDEYSNAAKAARAPSETLTQRFEAQSKRQTELAETISETTDKIRIAKQALDENQGLDTQASANIKKRKDEVISLGQAWREAEKAVAGARAVLEEKSNAQTVANELAKQAKVRLEALEAERKAAKERETNIRKEVAEAKKAKTVTDEQIKLREEAIQVTKRLDEEIKKQRKSEADLRKESSKLSTEVRNQNKAVDKLTASVTKHGKAYKDAKNSLSDFEQEQKKLGVDRQNASIDSLTKSLTDLEAKYKQTSDKLARTTQQLNTAVEPDPRAVQRFETLRRKIQQTEEEIKDQVESLRRMKTEYAENGASAEKLAAAQQRLDNITENLTREQEQLNAELQRSGQAMTQVSRKTKDVGKQFRVWGQDSRQALSFVQRIRGELLSLAGATVGLYAAGRGVTSIYDAAVLTQKATARLSARFDGDMKAVAEEMAFVESEADRLKLSIEVLLDEYTKFITSVPEGTLTLEQIRFTFSSVAEAARVVGLSTDELGGVFKALSQIASKGTTQLEELKDQLGERIPAAVQSAAKGLSELSNRVVSTQELLEKINKGEVTSDLIVALAKALKDEFGPELNRSLESPSASLAEFQNQLFKIRQELAKSGFLDVLVEGLSEITRQMKTKEFKEGLLDFAKAISTVAQGLIFLVKNFDDVIKVLTVLLGIKVAGYLGSMLSAVLQLSSSLGSLSATAVTATTSIKALGASVLTLFKIVVPVIAAFSAGFAVGKWLNQFDIVKKAAYTLVAVIDGVIVGLKGNWDRFLLYFELGWKETIRTIADLLVEALTFSFRKTLELAAELAGTFSDDLERKLKKFSVEPKNQANKFLNSLLGDGTEYDKRLKEIKTRVQDEIERIKKDVEDYSKFLDEQADKGAPKVLKKEDAQKQAAEFNEELFKGLEFFREKSNFDEVLKAFERIQDEFAEKSADTLEERLQLIENDYKDFLNELSKYEATTNGDVTDIQEKSKRLVEEVNAKRLEGRITEEQRVKAIADIEKRSTQEIGKLRKEQGQLAGARRLTQQLIAQRKEQETQKFLSEEYRKQQQVINRLTGEHREEQSRINELASLNLITTDEQISRLSKSNDDYIAKIRIAIEEAKRLANVSGNVELGKFLERFDDLSSIENAKHSLNELKIIEQEINDQLDARATKLDLLRTKLEQTNGTAKERNAILKEINEAEDKSNTNITILIEKAQKLAEAMGGADAQKIIDQLELTKLGLQDVSQEILNADQLNQDFASGFVDAVESFARGTQTMGEAFRQFIADFLRQIAKAILQQIILNAVSGAFGGGNYGQIIAGAVNSAGATQNHSGGIAGKHGTRRNVNPDWFKNAVRYHSGGIAGLKPDEVPAILQRGEQIIPRDKVGQQNNSGGNGSIKIINAIDSPSVLNEALSSSTGQKAILNFMRANKSQVKTVLS